MSDRVFNVLFLCTGNTARSILAESILRKDGSGRFRAFSAGSQPKGRVNPLTVEVLTDYEYPTDGLRWKNWGEFAAPGAPLMDFVFTVCDSAAGEACPVWPGQPMTAHWGVEDPAAFVGPEDKARRLFRAVYGMLENRIKIFSSLPIRSLDRLSLQGRLQEIGRMREGAEVPEEA